MRQSKAQASGTTEEEIVMYDKEELMANSKALFDCAPEVFVGALQGDSETMFSIQYVNQAIQNFLQRKVQE
ncbi:hypothetical protein GQF01_16005 [Paenibacillus sp. 5J-6]|uniref:YqzN/YkzM domain-containing protein n=1 Tax=Paenibacillus silvestris TaxID=2606219 RepID=A0A6L8V242_9BACL|nr:hypothetical protein [Paenibacillus silvestris]MZQ83616.1 hypothetical protein [Paenibacillus silvestris]